MHDATFAKQIVSAVNARKKSLPQGARIVGVRVLLSPLSHVTKQSLTDAFKTMVGGTDLEGLELHIDMLKLPLICESCGTRSEVVVPTFACPQCGDPSIAICDCPEFKVESVDVEGA